jgi:peptidoglycan-associated lipoprotein
MRLNFVSLFAAVLLVAACADDTTMVSNEGSSMTGDSATGQVTAGSPEDFLVNVGDRVFYGFDRYDLTAAARATLERQAEWLQRYSNRRIVIEGHADERGTREYNLALGERRANAAKNYLVAVGVSPSRITTISYGKEQPAVLGATEAAWAQNRRGVTVVN